MKTPSIPSIIGIRNKINRSNKIIIAVLFSITSILLAEKSISSKINEKENDEVIVKSLCISNNQIEFCNRTIEIIEDENKMSYNSLISARLLDDPELVDFNPYYYRHTYIDEVPHSILWKRVKKLCENQGLKGKSSEEEITKYIDCIDSMKVFSTKNMEGIDDFKGKKKALENQLELLAGVGRIIKENQFSDEK